MEIIALHQNRDALPIIIVVQKTIWLQEKNCQLTCRCWESRQDFWDACQVKRRRWRQQQQMPELSNAARCWFNSLRVAAAASSAAAATRGTSHQQRSSAARLGVMGDWPASDVNCRRRCVAIGRRSSSRRAAAAAAAAGRPLWHYYVIVITAVIASLHRSP